MKPIDYERVNAAIRECLPGCVGSCCIPVAVADFCDTLRQQGWGEEELHEVDVGAQVIIYAILNPLESASADSKVPKLQRA
jgi:hypothetical protein